MVSSGMLRRVALVRTDISEELSASFIRVTSCNYQLTHAAKKYVVFLHSMHWLLLTASIVPSSPILVNLMKEALNSSETSVLTRATRRNSPEYAILHCLLCSNDVQIMYKIHKTHQAESDVGPQGTKIKKAK
jgi:hypothetical protein